MASEENCVKALDQHEEKLSANPQVQGLGVVTQEGKPLGSEDCAVAVYVEKKVPDEEIAAEHRLPATLSIELEGARHEVPVRVIEQGPVVLEGPGMEAVDGAVPGLVEPGVGLEEIGAESPGLETEPASDEDSEE